MQLYLMRHGEAVSPSEWNGPDSSRPLTPIGQAKLEAAAEEMKRVGFAVSLILSSPAERAHKTAEVFSKQLSLPSPLLCPELSSGAPLEAIRKTILAHSTNGPALLIGHMPEIAIFGARVTTDPLVMDRGFQPGDVLALETGALDAGWGDGRVLWWRKIADWKKVKA